MKHPEDLFSPVQYFEVLYNILVANNLKGALKHRLQIHSEDQERNPEAQAVTTEWTKKANQESWPRETSVAP